jgi:hypothetical protein
MLSLGPPVEHVAVSRRLRARGAGHEHAQGCIGPRAVHGIVRNGSTGSVRYVVGDAPALFTERKTKAIGPFPRL